MMFVAILYDKIKKEGKYEKKNFLLRCIIVIVGLAIEGLGIAAYYSSGLGSDPASVLIDGLHRILDISYGNATYILMGIVLVLIIPFSKKYLGFSTILNALLLGMFINFFGNIFASLIYEPSLFVKIVLLVIGVLSLGIGLGIYLSADLGVGPLDILMLISADFINQPLSRTRIFFDFIFVVVGVIMGGVVGIGTVAGIVFTGIIIQQTLKKSSHLVNIITA